MTRSGAPNGFVGNPKPAPPLFALLKCPSCGRDPAIVFPLIRDHTTVDAAPLVCLSCCLTVRSQDNRPAVVGRASLATPDARYPMSNDPAPGPRRLLRCPACSRTDDVTHADLMRYTRVGWPKCCGLTMAYFMEAARPAGGGDRFSYQCPTCGYKWSATFPPGVELPTDAGAECEQCRRRPPAVPPT